jgi:hypothetical protein
MQKRPTPGGSAEETSRHGILRSDPGRLWTDAAGKRDWAISARGRLGEYYSVRRARQITKETSYANLNEMPAVDIAKYLGNRIVRRPKRSFGHWLIERRETALRPTAFVRDPGDRKRKLFSRPHERWRAYAFCGGHPRGAVFQALGEIEKNWVPFAYLQL